MNWYKKWLKAIALLVGAGVVASAVTIQSYNGTGANSTTVEHTWDDSGNYTAAGTITSAASTVTGNSAVTGNSTVTGNQSVTGNNTVTGFRIYTSSAVTFTSAGQQFTPVGSYILLQPSALAANTLMTGVPTISTATALGGQTAFTDGTELVIQSTSTTAMELQDNGTLSGSQLYLGSSSQGSPLAFIQVSSTQTVKFMYNSTLKGWVRQR